MNFELFPGKSAFDLLEEADFENLINREIFEGQFLEFKSEMPVAKKLTQQIAAFANSYGGWILIGVAETSGGRVASCPGIDLSANIDPVAFIRNICRDLIVPFPSHTVRFVKKCDGKLLIAIEVTESSSTPHVCSDGTIPLRAAASVEKLGLANHSELARLVGKSEKLAKNYLAFARDERRDNGYDYASSLSIYICPASEVELHYDLKSILSGDGLKAIAEVVNQAMPNAVWEGIQIMGESGGTTIEGSRGTSQIPFDAIYSHAGSIFFEQGNRGGAFMQLDLNGRFRAHLPLGVMRETDEAFGNMSIAMRNTLMASFSNGYSGAFDAVNVWQAAAHVISFYLSHALKVEPVAGYRFSLELDDVQGLVPFVKTEDWLAHVSSCGFARYHSRRRSMPISREDPFFVASDKLDLRSMFMWMTSMLLGMPVGLLLSGWESYMSANVRHDAS